MGQGLRQRLLEDRPGKRQAVWVTVLATLAIWLLPLGQGFVHWSFDLPTVLHPARPQNDVLLVQLDQPSLTELGQSYGNFNRTNYANLLKKLTAGPARLVVFDVVFAESDPRPEDVELEAAIKANGRVVLAADYTRVPGYPAGVLGPPLPALRAGARSWGVSCVARDTDLTVRLHEPGPESRQSLAWAAVEAMGAQPESRSKIRDQERWLRYYGGEGTMPARSFYIALDQAPEVFRDKIVFVGGKPTTRKVGEEADEFASPHTRWGGPMMSGMEIQATTVLNLKNNEWLTRMPAWAEFCLLVVCGIMLGAGMSLLRPTAGLAVGLGIAVGIAVLAFLLFWKADFWFSWLLISGVEVPCAWACSAFGSLRTLQRERSVIEGRLAAAQAAVALMGPGSNPQMAGPTKVVGPQALDRQPAQAPGECVPAEIADHTLVRRIGKGAYGEVFLGRNPVGLYHAVKVVYRDSFPEDEPYEREFRGIQKYMPVSLSHPGFIPLLHVGRNDPAGCFYYVMELGDGETGTAESNPEAYSPRSLAGELKRHGALPVVQCVEMFLALTDALNHLHLQKLVHRDIKPSNIIFVKGVPKFADIGLVTDIAATGHDVSYVGTEGYIPPEGPGTPAADVYSLGMVAYQVATGLDRRRFPELPNTLTQRPDMDKLVKFNRIVLKACQPQANQRYQSAGEMRADLLSLRG